MALQQTTPGSLPTLAYQTQAYPARREVPDPTPFKPKPRREYLPHSHCRTWRVPENACRHLSFDQGLKVHIDVANAGSTKFSRHCLSARHATGTYGKTSRRSRDARWIFTFRPAARRLAESLPE